MAFAIVTATVFIILFVLLCWRCLRTLRPAKRPEESTDAILASVSANARGACACCVVAALILFISFVMSMARIGHVAVPAIARGGATVENTAPVTLEREGDGTSQGRGDTSVELVWGDRHVQLIAWDGSSAVTESVQLALFTAVALVGVRFFSQVAKTRRPFETPRARELFACASLVLISGFVPIFVSSVIVLSVFPTFGYSGAWAIGSASWPQVFLGLIVFIFARIFQYGCLLQEQDDALL